jgi:microcystin-dependent protein
MEPFIAEIRMFGAGYAPKNWALCKGDLLAISQNTALFSLIGTNFGGDGRVTFGLPNFNGSAPIGAGAGAGLSPYAVGEEVGVTTVTLTSTEMPAHSHQMSATFNVGDLQSPTNRTVIARASAGNAFAADSGNTFDTMDPSSLSPFPGRGGPHNNAQPFLAVNFIIALAGIFPSRP